MKMLKGGKSKKQWYDRPTPTPRPSANQTVGFKTPNKRNEEGNSRLRVLNSLLFKAVSELLVSHEVNPKLPYLNVDISKVSLAPDFSACRIYWKTSGTSERDDEIQQLLDKNGPRIRYLLISQQVIGGVPALVFIRDKQYAALNEIDALLKIADFGPEENLEETTKVKDRRLVPQPLESAEEHQPGGGKRPVLFGIDHDALLRTIQEYKQQVGDASSTSTLVLDTPMPGNLTQQQVDAIADIRRQKLIEKKKRKSKRMLDNDITPKAFLLAKHSKQRELTEDLDGMDYGQEDDQIRELMAEDNKKS